MALIEEKTDGLVGANRLEDIQQQDKGDHMVLKQGHTEANNLPTILLAVVVPQNGQ